jgi:hypothetical protein
MSIFIKGIDTDLLTKKVTCINSDGAMWLIYSELSAADQATYDAFTSVYGSKLISSIINYPNTCEMCIIDSSIVNDDFIEQDYNTLSQAEKDTIDNFYNLMHS